VSVELPAVISVGDAINEPRYPSLKAIMGAKKKPRDVRSTSDVGIEDGRVGQEGSRTEVLAINAPADKAAGDVGIEADRIGEQGSQTQVLSISPPPEKAGGEIIEDEDTNETVDKIVAWLDERKLLA
ncbi:MAG: hypothetical protein ABWY95_11460, partial [Thermoleophilaceae bacterium]